MLRDLGWSAGGFHTLICFPNATNALPEFRGRLNEEVPEVELALV